MDKEEGEIVPRILETASGLVPGDAVIVVPSASREGERLIQMVMDKLSLSSLEKGITYWWGGETGLNLFILEGENVKWIY